jgi:hypothetical protein
MTYELMQLRYLDASWRAVSLDDQFYVYAMDPFKAVAVFGHRPTRKDELELIKGDILNGITTFDKNKNSYVNGFVYVFSERLKKRGLVPFYKIKIIN